MARLTSNDPNCPAISYPLRETTRIGRDPRNEVHLGEDSVSRYHAEIQRSHDSFVLVDLGSSNGTFLNGKRIERENLQQGDLIEVGGHRFVFCAEEPDEPYRSPDTVFRSYTRDIMAKDLAGGKSRTVEKFDEFLSLCELCASADSLSKFTPAFCDGLTKLFESDHSMLVLHESEGSHKVLETATGKLVDLDATHLVSESILKAVTEDGEGILMQDPQAESRFKKRASIIENRICTAMAIPIGKGSTPTAMLYCHRLDPALSFTDEDLRLLFGLSLPVAGALESIARTQQLTDERDRLRRATAQKTELLGDHSSMVAVRNLIAKLAGVDSTVLIIGKTGTGKELVARALHNLSARKDAAFEAVNCAAISETLVESELFGHEKGAFTGADESRAGAFEIANGGTLFLDEIGELTPKIQAKLLRVLENREIRRVGGNTVKKVDVRVLAATNRNLTELVESGEFRTDLYYRINVMSITMPELKSRASDIKPLALHFLSSFAARIGAPKLSFSPDALDLLPTYSWPGNVRELRNVIERATILCDGEVIRPENVILGTGTRMEPTSTAVLEEDVFPVLADLEKMHILKALELADGNKSKAAALLGIDRSTLYAKLKGFDIET